MSEFYGGNLELFIELESILLIFDEDLAANTLIYVEKPVARISEKKRLREETYYSQSFEYIPLR